MDKTIKKYNTGVILFTVGQFFTILGIFSVGSYFKALSEWLILFTIASFVGAILMAISSLLLFKYNRHYFLFFLTTLFYLFCTILQSVADESTVDMTVAWSRGLAVSEELLLCLIYMYFFLGARDYIKENGLATKRKSIHILTMVGFIFVIFSTITVNVMDFIRTFNAVKTNYVATLVLKYGALLIRLVTSVFILVVLINTIVVVNVKHSIKQKQIKAGEIFETEEEQTETGKKRNRFVRFITNFITILASVLIIPSIFTIGQYIFTIDQFFYNEYYEGVELNIDDSKFELTGIKQIGKVSQGSTNLSYQGAACYKDKYVVCLDNLEAIHIYDSKTMKLVHTVKGSFDRYYHCNQAFFGNDYYKKSDEYPLLYIAMEHKEVTSTVAFRIYKRGGIYCTEEIQTIKLVFDEPEDTIYFPNSYYDYDRGLIYYGGYTEDTYMRSDTNKLKYYVFPMPSYREEYYELHTDNVIETFTLPSETATQGGFISHSHLYQTFSFGSKTDPLRMPVMRVVDLKNKKIIKEYKNLGEQFGAYEEFEHVAINEEGRMFSLGNPFNIYEFEYKAQ